MSWIGVGTLEILLNHRFELLECAGLNIELPFEVRAHSRVGEWGIGIWVHARE